MMPRSQLVETDELVSTCTIPVAVAAFLRAARAQEQQAKGAARRQGFRTTRVIIGALIDLGYSRTLIGDLLGVSPDSVRDRSDSNGILDLQTAAILAGISPADLINSRQRHLDDGTESLIEIRAIDVVRTLEQRRNETTNRPGDR